MSAPRFMSGFTVAKTGAIIATSGTSASVAIPTNSSGEIPRWVRIAATQAACVRLTKGASTAVTTDLQVQPGDAVIIRSHAFDTVSAIQVTSAGVVQISPLEDL